MFDRRLTKKHVITVIGHGRVIMEYPDDKPYPSCLMLGFSENTPIHVVFAVDKENRIGIVVTAYIPDGKVWTDGFTLRR